MRNNICLCFHCICDDGVKVKGPHRELFVAKSDLKALFGTLASRGYVFSVPWNMRSDKPNCVVTFDDGYYNIINFLEISEMFNIPFIVFTNTYNILTGKPFIWDIWDSNYKGKFPYLKIKTSELYIKFGKDEFCDGLKSNLYRPFRLEELVSFSNNKNVYLGIHTHNHQPFVRRFRGEWASEIENNKKFFDEHGLKYENEFSLPNGIYTFGALKWAKKHFKRIYTINGNYFDGGDSIIDRISLVSPSVSVSLIEQVDRNLSVGVKRKIKKSITAAMRMKFAYIG